jgi:hypothetical protein
LIIAIYNRSSKLSNLDLRVAIRAINRQLSEDFGTYWDLSGKLRLEPSNDAPIKQSRLPKQRYGGDQHHDAAVYVLDREPPASEGYHEAASGAAVPLGFVCLDSLGSSDEEWTVALSREALSLMVDPANNLLVQGPHLHDRRHLVLHAMNPCNAVRGETYEIEGVKVSNFVFPNYFMRSEHAFLDTDFLGRPEPGRALPRFGVAPGGVVHVWDDRITEGRRWQLLAYPGDDMAARFVKADNASRLSRTKLRQGSRP